MSKRQRIIFSKKSVYMLLILLAGDIETNPGPSFEDALRALCMKCGLKIFHQNICGLSGKFDEVRQMLLSRNRIDVLGMTETFLSTESKKDFSIPGYTFVARHRKSGHGGGVGVYIRDGIDFDERDDLYEDNVEGVFIEISPKKSKHFLIAFSIDLQIAQNIYQTSLNKYSCKLLNKFITKKLNQLSWEI